MTDELSIEDRVKIALDLLDVLEGPMNSVSKLKWTPVDGFWTLIVRSVLVRQFEALRTIADLVQSERAYLAVPLLRPAVEEFLWVKFLLTLTIEDREKFIASKTLVEQFETLEAQWNDAGEAVMNKLGFPTKFRDAMEAASKRGLEDLKEMALRLRWDIKNVKKKPIPSTWVVAKQTGNEEMYSLLYHATSRTVHFTASELLRRTWGNAEEVTVSSKMMAKYWAGFSLYWGPRIFLLTFLELIDEFERLNIEIEIGDDLDGVFKRYLSLGKVPIITAEEMNLSPQQKW